MIIFWRPNSGGGGGGVSTDPGIANVLVGVAYEINSVPLVGTLEQYEVTNVFQQATLIGQSLQAILKGELDEPTE
jgi:hypothetical protein